MGMRSELFFVSHVICSSVFLSCSRSLADCASARSMRRLATEWNRSPTNDPQKVCESGQHSDRRNFRRNTTQRRVYGVIQLGDRMWILSYARRKRVVLLGQRRESLVWDGGLLEIVSHPDWRFGAVYCMVAKCQNMPRESSSCRDRLAVGWGCCAGTEAS